MIIDRYKDEDEDEDQTRRIFTRRQTPMFRADREWAKTMNVASISGNIQDCLTQLLFGNKTSLLPYFSEQNNLSSD